MTTIDLATLRLLLTADNSQLKPKIEESKGIVSRFGQVAETVLGVSIVGAFQQAAAAAVQFAQQSSAEFKQFQAGVSEIYTLMPGASASAMAKMKSDVMSFGLEVGRTTDETVPALYQALSSGVPPDNVFEFLETASNAARGGVTDLETAVDGITSVVNAYGPAVIGAAEASDLMFAAVVGGKTTFEELSRSLFNVIPTAASTGVVFSDVTAALAAMTAQGVPTSVATTQMRQLLVDLSKEGGKTSETFERIAGKSFREFIASGGDLQGALQLLEGEAQRTGTSVSDFFGSVEAGSAALTLTGQGTQRFSEELDRAADSLGSTAAAAETMGDTALASDAKIAALTEQFQILVGEALQPGVQAFNDLKVAALESLIPIAKAMGTTYADAAEMASTATVEMGKSAESPTEAYKKLQAALDATYSAGGFLLVMSPQLQRANTDLRNKTAELIGTTFDFTQHQEKLHEIMMLGVPAPSLTARAYKELEEQLQATYGEQLTVKDGMVLLNGYVLSSVSDLSEMAGATDTLGKAQESAAADIKFFTQAAESQADALEYHFEATKRVSDALEEMTDKQAQAAAQTGTTEQAVKSANLANERAIEAQQRLSEATSINQARLAGLAEATRSASLEMVNVAAVASGEYFNAIVQGTAAEESFATAFYNSAAAKGASSAQLALLTSATLGYTDAQTQAMLADALRQAKTDELTSAYLNHEISLAGVAEEMRLFELEVNNLATAQLTAAQNSDAQLAATQPLTDGMNNAALAAENLGGAIANLPDSKEISVHTSYTESGQTPVIPGGVSGPDKEKPGAGEPRAGASSFSFAPSGAGGSTGSGITIYAPISVTGVNAQEVEKILNRQLILLAERIRGKVGSGQGRK